MRPLRLLCAALLLGLCVRTSSSARPLEDPCVYLENRSLRIGVSRESGACIGWLSAAGSARNLLNHFDRGRFVQQSYYGDPDGSKWNAQPWRYNPVQGGSWRGEPSKLLAFRAGKDRIYARVQPRHWAAGDLLPEVTMEEWIVLEGDIAHVRCRLRYTGAREHAPASQEVPALFVQPELDTLVACTEGKPWAGAPLARRRPGWPNEQIALAERWAAYVGSDDFGIGIYAPKSTAATCYRYHGPAGAGAGCSYIAPLVTFALKPGLTYDYDYYLTLGRPDQIRARFQRLAPHAG